MISIIVTPKDKTEHYVLISYLKRKNIGFTIISNKKSQEDSGLQILMRQANRTKTVDRKTIMKKLSIW
ncbi:MAG: hypothetical protein EHM58_13420 [Ignavibacteriae bacterium]|nr:MAG: hypothetical protein EHM58_13420 [Ignavibacteriota bacterium]